MNFTDSTYLQVEATTKCNAWCPGCARNKGGYELNPNLVIEDLDLTKFQNLLSQLPNLDIIDFCGTYGDAIAAANIFEQTELSKKHARKIIVRTNGSLRNQDWWQSYARLLQDQDHEVWFCLDGLADTHSVYRQATDFDTIIANAKSFMSAGGVAVWQFIPWQHNQHQIRDCMRLSQQLGFKRFEFVRDVRRNFTARHYQTGDVIPLEPWDRDQITSKYQKIRSMLKKENCRHLSQPSLYLNASGKISPCCFFNTHLSVDDIQDLPNIEQSLNSPMKTCINFCAV